jgi:hypothetical protein
MAGCLDDYIICNDDYLCECICYQQDEDCTREPAACCVGLSCDVFNNTCMPDCTSDADCQARIDVPHAEDLECQAGLCDFDHCTQDAECVPGKVCHGGDCITVPDCTEIAYCRVTPDRSVTEAGSSVQLSAAAYMQDGSLFSAFSFGWQSSSAAVASVDSSGLVTGGSTTGSAVITASVTGCSTTCQATVVNYGGVPAGQTRVLVVDELEGVPVQGATVVVGAELPATTDATGLVVFGIELSAANPADITVSKADYEYITLMAVESADVIIHLRRIYHLDQNGAEVAGGIRGTFNFDPIRCEPPNNTCDVSIGFAGLGTPGSLALLTPYTIFGDPVMVEIELGGSTEEVPLSESMVMALNQTHFKEFYTPTGIPGTRAAWGLGGKTDLAALIDKLGPIISGGSNEMDDLKMSILMLPMLGFHSAIAPGVEISAIPELLDINDLNNNGRTDDFVPDYGLFPALDMIPKVPATQTLTFVAPQLQVGAYDSVLVITGVIAPGTGFLPLGMSFGEDSLDAEDIPDGVIDDPIVVPTSEVVGRLPEEGLRRVVVALALSLDNLNIRAGQVLLVQSFDQTVTPSAFMPPPVATYDPVARNLNITQLPASTDVVQIVATDDMNRRWHLFSDSSPLTSLPAAPPQGDRADRVGIIALLLGSPVTYQDLPEFNDTNLGDLAELVSSFSYTQVP